MIATLATRAADEGIDVIIVTGDRDSYQLVHDPHIKVLYNRRGVSDYALYDEAGIVERTGVTAGAVPRVRRAARRPERQPARRSRRRREDRGQAHHHLRQPRGDLRAPRRAAAEATSEPRRGARPRVPQPRDVAAASATSTLDVEPADLAQGAWDRDQVRVLFDQLAFRTLLPRLLEAVGEVGGRRPTRSRPPSTSRSPCVRDAAAVLGADRRASSAAGELYAIEPRWEGAPVTSRAARDRARDRRRRGRLHRRRAARAIPTVRDALVGLLGADGPPLVAHRAKELMHGLDVDIRSLQHDTAVMAYLLDPGAGEVPARRPRAALPRRSRCSRPTPSPARSTSTASIEIEQTGRRAAVVLQLAAALDDGARRARAHRPLRALRAAARARARRRWRRPASASTASSSRSCAPSSAQQCETLVQRIYAHAGEEFNVNSTPQLRTILFEKLGLVPVKKTKTGPSTDADSLQKMADEHPIVEDLLRYREVEKLRSTYADALPPLIARRRPHPRHVQADRHHHRSHLERGAQPPERPGAHRRRPRDAPRVHRRRRAAGSSPPTTRRSSCACSRTSPRIPG